MGVAGDERDPREASGHQAAEEAEPRGAVLSGDHLQTEDLAVAVAVDAGRDQRGGLDDPPALADLEREGIGLHEAVRPTIQRPRAEGADALIQAPGELADLGLGHPADAKGCDQLVDPAGRDAEHVRLGDDLRERALAAPARLEQPVRKVRILAQLGDAQVDRPKASVPAPVAVPVALVDALRRPGAMRGAGEAVDVGGHDPIDDVVQEVAQQVRLGLLELLANERDRLHRLPCHRCRPSQRFFDRMPRGGWHGGSLCAGAQLSLARTPRRRT